LKVTILKHMGCGRRGDTYYHHYVLQAENGIIEEDEADVFLPTGYVLDLPDDEWQPDSEEFSIKCDRCGNVYTKKSIRGYTVYCPICNMEEVIPL